MEENKLPYGEVEKVYNKILKFTSKEYNEMKDETGWENIDVANIVGYKHMSVKNQTRPSNPLPIWAQLLVFVWQLEYKKFKYFPEGKAVEQLQEMFSNFRKEFNKNLEELNTIRNEKEELEVKLRKEERKNKKLATLLEKLSDIESDTEADLPETLTEAKREINSLNSKHRRKVKVLNDIKSLIEVPEEKSEPTKKVTKPKGKKVGRPKGATKGVKKGTPATTKKAGTRKRTTSTRKKKVTSKSK
jgi:hypothetical protein